MSSLDNGYAPTEIGMYFREILGLIRPGHPIPVFDEKDHPEGDLAGWGDHDFKLLIEEGRRQIDSQTVRLEALRTRAQIILTTATAVLGLTIAGLKTIANDGGIVVFIIWFIAIGADLLAVLGAAAVITVRKDMGALNANSLSQNRPPIAQKLASAYARSVTKGEATIAREVTVFRDAVLLMIVSVVLYSLSWFVAVT